MAKTLTVCVFLANIIISSGQEDKTSELINPHPQDINPNYSFGYGVADTHTGDIKTVWEAKEGDTVKGHYSILEPDGSMRSVEYSAGPKTGFTATVNNEDTPFQESAEGRDMLEDKALRDYDKQFDSLEGSALESYYNERKRRRHPYENLFKEYLLKKRPQHSSDHESSDFSHSITIKHPHDEANAASAAESHIGFNFDPNCLGKNKLKESSNTYSNTQDFDFRRQKYPSLSSFDSYKNDFEKYVSDSSNVNMDKILQIYKHSDKYKPFKSHEEFGDWSSTKHGLHGLPDIPSENIYSDYLPPRPKKKYKPHKKPEPFEVEDLDDYILVPKKKHKKPPTFAEPDDYRPEIDEEFDDSFDEDGFYKPPRVKNHKEVVRKVVKKKKPVINILDIFDI